MAAQYQFPESWPATLRRNAVLIIDLIAAAADKGERCPTATEFARRNLALPTIAHLAEAGILRTEVYGKNWRVVFICQGAHRGKSTKEAPYSEPYLVIGPERPVAA